MPISYNLIELKLYANPNYVELLTTHQERKKDEEQRKQLLQAEQYDSTKISKHSVKLETIACNFVQQNQNLHLDLLNRSKLHKT